MKTQRVTISMPDYLYNELKLVLGTGNMSSFITEAAEEKLLDEKITTNKNPFEGFFALRKNAPKLTDRQIMNAIRKGRT